MSFIEMKEIYDKWTARKEINKFSFKIGIYIEELLKMNNLGNVVFYIVNLYLFVYEFQKTNEIFLNFNDKYTEVKDFHTNLLKVINYFSLETYFVYNYDSFWDIIILLSISVIQLFIFLFFIIDCFRTDANDTHKEAGTLRNFTFNLIQIIMVCFAYSFNYINLKLIITFLINFRDFYSYPLNVFTFITNLMNFLCFTFIYVCFCYLMNDVSPQENKYYPSTSEPFFNILTYLKFVIYNSFLIILSFIPNYILYFFIICYYIFYIYYLLIRVYFIHRSYLCLNIAKNLFYFIFFLSQFCLSFMEYNEIIRNYKMAIIYFIIISLFLSCLMIPYVIELRLKYYCKLNNYNNINKRNFYCDELYVYHLYSSKEITIAELFKHKSLCKYDLLDEKCICMNVKNKYIFDEEEIDEIKSSTCLLLSKLCKNAGKFNLLHFNSLLRNNKISYSLFPYLLNFDINQIHFSNIQFLIRIVKKFIHKYKEFYSSSTTKNVENNKNKLSLETLNKLIVYEFSFRTFLKNIKKAFFFAKDFWNLVLDKPINFKKFMDNGLELAKVTISISQDFGNMQKIHPHRIKLLKAYSCFMNSVLNDSDYSEILVILIKEKLQMINNISQNINSTFLDKDVAIITISGEADKLFQILSYNKYAKNSLKISSIHSLKYMNMHYLLPFPFNIFHNGFLKYRFDLTLLSKERVIYCIEENGNLVYIQVNALPCMNFAGKINFFVTFLIDTSHKITALVDLNGNIYSATKEFKEEFNVTINCNMKKAIELYEMTQHIIKKSGYEVYHCIENILKNVDSNCIVSFPKIFDVFEESKSFIIPKNMSEKDIERFFTSRKSSINKILKDGYIDETKQKSDNDLPILKSSILKKRVDKKSVPSNQKILKVNNPLVEKEISTIESLINEDKLVNKKKSLKKFKYEDLPKNHSITLYKDNQKLEVSIEPKTVLCGLFSYFYIWVKKSEMTSESIFVPHTEENHVIQENTFVNTSIHHGSYMDKGSITSSLYNMSGGVQRENKFKIGLFLSSFQNAEITITTMSKIFKKIFIYLILIFLALSSMKIIQLFYNLYYKANIIDNFNVLNSFIDMRFGFYYLIMNTRVLTNLRLKIFMNDYSIFKNRQDYLNKSFTYDFHNFENILNNLRVTDLSSYPQLNQIKSSPLINFTTLGNNYEFEHSVYDLFAGLNIYISVIKENVIEGDFNIKDYENYLNIFQRKQSGTPGKNLRNIYFIFSNYITSISKLLSDITKIAIENCNETISKSDNNYYIFLLLEIFIYVFVIILGFLLVRDIYLIHSFLKYFFSTVKTNLVEEFLVHLNESEKIILDFKNDGENLDHIVKKIVNKTETNKGKNGSKVMDSNYRNSTTIKKERDEIINEINNQDQEVSPNSTSIINKTSKSLLQNENSTKNNNNRSLFEKSNYIDEKNFKKKRFNKSIDDDESNNDIYNHSKGVYIWYFLKGSLFFLSFFYNIILQILIGFYLVNKVKEITYQKYLITTKAETELFLIDSLQHIIFNNHTAYDNQNNIDLFSYYSNLFEKYQFEFNNYGLLQSNFIQEINNKTRTYYSENFCSYFYKETNNYLSLNPNTNYSNCLSSVLNSGIQLYLYSLKNDFISIYSGFNVEKNKTVNYLIEKLRDDAFNFGTIVHGYYLRGFYNDLFLSLQNYFSFIILTDKNFSILLFVVFILHIIIVGYFIFYRNMENIYFYFEKIRILFSIIPKDMMKKKTELREFLDKYY